MSSHIVEKNVEIVKQKIFKQNIVWKASLKVNKLSLCICFFSMSFDCWSVTSNCGSNGKFLMLHKQKTFEKKNTIHNIKGKLI